MEDKLIKTNRLTGSIQQELCEKYSIKEIEKLFNGTVVYESFSHYQCNSRTYRKLMSSSHPYIEYYNGAMYFLSGIITIDEDVAPNCVEAKYRRFGNDMSLRPEKYQIINIEDYL